MFDMSKFDIAKLEDCEVLGVDTDGCVLQWDASGSTTGAPSPYNCGTKLADFEEQEWEMTDIERMRCGFEPKPKPKPKPKAPGF